MMRLVVLFLGLLTVVVWRYGWSLFFFGLLVDVIWLVVIFIWVVDRCEKTGRYCYFLLFRTQAGVLCTAGFGFRTNTTVVYIPYQETSGYEQART